MSIWAWFVIGLVVAGLLVMAVRIVRQFERGVLLGFGKLAGTRSPGLNIIIPFIDQLTKVSLRVNTTVLEPQEVITKDNVFEDRALRSLLADAGNPAEAAFVGHEPDLGALAATLLSLREDFPLRKGAVVALEVEGSAQRAAAKFLWLEDGKGTATRLPGASGR